MDYKEYIFKQNPWILAVENISQDQTLLDLKQEDFIWKNKEFLDHNFQSGVYLVTGMRQIGKTTHLKMLIKEKINNRNKENFFYFNCDLLSSKKEIVDIVEFYLNQIASKGKKIYLILDEIIAVKDGILAVKYLIDSGWKKNIVYILSGSSSVNFKRTGEFLPGRRGSGRDFVFSSLSFAEFLEIKYPQKYQEIKNILSKNKNLVIAYQKIKALVNLDQEFNKYLIAGGIPRIINVFARAGRIPTAEFQSYLSWIKSEIAKNQKDEYYVRVILERIKQSLSSDLSYNSIAQDSGVGSHNTIYSYLNFLVDSFIISQLYNYDFYSGRVQRKKNKKIYFNDPFIYWLVCFWLGFGSEPDFGELSNNILKSRLVENAVAIFLKKKFANKLYFYRANYELDFITPQTAIEIKYQNKISSDDLKNIKKFPGKKIVLSKSTLEINQDLKIIPVELFLLL